MTKVPLPFFLLIIFGGGILFGLAVSNRLPWGDERTVHVYAKGTAEWLYQDTHNADDGGLPEKIVGTPQSPKGLDLVPLANRAVSADGLHFSSLRDGQIFSFDRTPVPGSISLDATDLTPLDATTSWDRAHVEATFSGPDGSLFMVVLNKLAPPNLDIQTFGGVAFNHLIHGESGLGTDKLVGVFAYTLVQGFADIYKNGVRISTGNYLYIATAQATNALNQNKRDGRYDPARPLGKLIVHLVVLPYNEAHDYLPVHTGIIGPDGKEQVFFHINYGENITVTGNRFLQENVP